jgi:hypothetical protein
MARTKRARFATQQGDADGGGGNEEVCGESKAYIVLYKAFGT